MTRIDIDHLAAILREAAKAEVLPRFRRLDADQIRIKSEAIDLVTEADTEAERVIKAAVTRWLPEALFVGEESVAADPALLGRLADAELAVIVDPVDGTANFAAGLPLFAVMASVVRDGETICGIIYDPMGDDWMMAEKGGGTWLKRPDGQTIKLKVADDAPLAEMIGTVSAAWIPQSHKVEVLSNLAKVRMFANYRVAGHDYRTFVSGHTNFSFYNKLMPWDHLAGALMAAEAGAHIRRLDGSEYKPHHIDGGLLMATSKDAWDALRNEVFTF